MDQYKRKLLAKKGVQKGREKGKRDGGKDKGKGKTGDPPAAGCFNCGGAHWRRDCKEPVKPGAGPKPPETVAVVQDAKAKSKAKRGRLAAGGDTTWVLEEEVRSLSEQLGVSQSHYDRVFNTIELTDFFAKQSYEDKEDSKPCYNLDAMFRVDKDELKKASDIGLGALIDKMQLVNPDFASVVQLDELSEDNFVMREHQRPAGYSAQTRVHMGRLCVPVLNDSGASCSCITEEQMVVLVNHTQHMLDEGHLTMEDYNYPIVQFYKYKRVAHLKGAEAEGKMAVEYAVLLRIEFIPEGASSGPVKEVYFKIFKKGCCGIIGAVFGWPTLDCQSIAGGEGLGWINQMNGACYSTLGVTLPRADQEIGRAHV